MPTSVMRSTRRHHSKWVEAQANHIAANRQLIEYRVQSLTVSHGARSKAIEEQVVRATNDKIRLMKESELTRANADFNLQMVELQQAANRGHPGDRWCSALSQ